MTMAEPIRTKGRITTIDGKGVVVIDAPPDGLFKNRTNEAEIRVEIVNQDHAGATPATESTP